jgi:hypothetical protein
VRSSTIILVLLVLVAACKRHHEPAPSSDEGFRKQLTGVWSGEHKFSSDSDSMEKIEMDRDGTFAATIAMPERKFGPHMIELNGTWRVENGFLIETTTRDSQTNSKLPSVWRAKIVHIDDRELELNAEKIDGVGYPTNQLIYTKRAK